MIFGINNWKYLLSSEDKIFHLRQRTSSLFEDKRETIILNSLKNWIENILNILKTAEIYPQNPQKFPYPVPYNTTDFASWNLSISMYNN